MQLKGYMQIVVLANSEQKAELLLKRRNKNVEIIYINNSNELPHYKNRDAFFLLQDEINFQKITLIRQPVFIHSVISTLADLKLPANVSRINAWPTFLQRNLWEVATNNQATVKNVFDSIGWQYLVTPDKPGLIAARVIAMIINEAYFTFEEKISTKEDIDIAMKLGTNYPYGPFEWTQKIGLQNIYNLLKVLEKDLGKRYDVAAALEKHLLNT